MRLDELLTRIVTTIIAGSALIGQAHAYDFTAAQATKTVAVAMLVDDNCPGIKLNMRKAMEFLATAGVPADGLDGALLAAQSEFKATGAYQRLCDLARDPNLPLHLMLDFQ